MKRCAVALALLLAVAGLPGLATTTAAAATPTAGQSLFVPLDPVRLTDTRKTVPPTPLGPGGVLDLLVADGVRVPLDATSVTLNVTADQASAATDVRVYPTPAGSAPPPGVSNLNVVPRRTVANLVTVKVGDRGRVRLRNQSGSVHLVVDLSGYTTTDPADASTYVPRAPVRLMDTRPGAPVGAGEVRQLDVRRTLDGSPSGVPDDATAVVLNVTAVAPSAPTDVRVYPTRAGARPPTVSNLNAGPGRNVPNLVVVAVGEGSRVSLRNQSGTVDLLADLAGWYVPGDAGNAFHPVDPVRLLTAERALLGPGGTQDLVVAGAGTVPAAATAVMLNVTAVGATQSTDVRVYPTPSGSAVPRVSNLNVVRGQTVPNAVLASVGRDGSVRLRNAAGSVRLIVDLAGWYAPTGDGWDISWPQCTTAGSTTSRLPSGGAFAVVGVTRGRPFTANECFAAQWDWASSLPGEPAVYLNTDAPGETHPQWSAPGPRECSGASSDSGCAYNYGYALAGYALGLVRTTPSGGKPFVWFDVENGPVWQTGFAGAVAVNRNVINGAALRLREAGHRYGLYTDRASTRTATRNDNDWFQIMGEWRLPLPVWNFAAPTTDPTPLCAPAESAPGGPVHMVQTQPAVSGQEYDVDHLC